MAEPAGAGRRAPGRETLLSAFCLLALTATFAGTLTALARVAVAADLPASGWAVAALWLLLAAWLARRAARTAGWRPLAACALAALALRLGALLAMPGLAGVHTGNDYAAYLALARHLIEGRGLIADTAHYGRVAGMYPPLYPLLLAGTGALLGVNAASVLVLNTIIDFAAAGLILVLGGRIGEEKAGRIAASLYLIWPNFAVSAPLAQKEGLIVLLALTIAFFALETRRRGPSWRNAAGLGLGTALLGLCQPVLITLPLFLVPALVPGLGLRGLAALAVRALPFALALMLPWWIRNWALFGAFVPLTTSFGPSLMVAAAGQHIQLPQQMAALAEPARSSLLADRAAALIAADPAGFLYHRAGALLRCLSIEDYIAIRLTGFRPPYSWARGLFATLQLAHSATVALAWWACLRLRDSAGARIAALLLAAALLQLAVVQPWFELVERHRHFMTPFLLLAAAIALARLLEDRGAPIIGVSGNAAD